MRYDFTSILDRRGDAIAVDVIPFKDAEVKEGFSRIPMWVADMNFATAPSVLESIRARLDRPTFGYFRTPPEYFDAIIRWQKERNGVEGLTAENIGYENGVLGGVAAAVQAFTAPGEAILLHSPTYVGFTGTLNGNGRKIVHSPLKPDENGVWRMDFEDMDRKLKEEKIHLAIFCSPHNPCGRVWERWEMEKAMEVYAANDCIVLCDEIWSDIILSGKHIPLQSISEDARKRVISFYATSKTFNLAGLIGSYHIVYNEYLHDRLKKQSSLSHYNSANVLSVAALIGAYNEDGAQWVDELCEVFRQNVDHACGVIDSKFKGVKVSKPQGTYMLYLDCGDWCRETGKSIEDLIRAGISVGVIWQDGRPFQLPDTIRMNLAVPYSMLVEAMDRLDKYVFNA